MEQQMTEQKIEQKAVSPHGKEWILSAIIVGMAYFYLSVIRYPTELARWIWWPAQLNTEYVRVGLSWMLFAAMFLTVGLWYAVACGRIVGKTWKERIPKHSWVYFGLTVAAGVWCPFYMKGDQDIGIYVVLFLHGTAVYWLMTVTGSRSGTELDERGIKDLAKGFFVLPIAGYVRIFYEWANLATCVLEKKFQKNSRVWQIVLGVLISVPILCITIPILRGADQYFDVAAGTLLSGVFDFMARMDLGSALSTGLWTLILACYFYGLFYKANYSAAPVERARKQAPQIVLGGFLVPILALYLVFFVVRSLGVAGAMEQIAEGELWISTYAREGFFELCRIAAVNFVIFTVVRWYSPQAGKGMRGLISVLGVETMAFVMLAFSKMWYYIQSYHSFTFKRAMCCWLLLTLLVTFGLMTAELWQKKVKGVKWGVLFGSVTFLMMAYSNMPVWAP
ncbi:MAG: DUF4173 domain-containing protein [Lachnospiraceae bacterium]|nr:DUF4173 domain-containing protein [Lachnospiraceae bacterium]